MRLRLGFPGDPRSPSLCLSGRARAAALREEGRSARPPLWLPQPESPPRGGKRGPGPADRQGDRLRAAHVQAESACPAALGAFSAARPHRRRRARPPSPQAACPESGLAGASSRGRAGSRLGARAREKARGPEDRPARTPEPRGRRPARRTRDSGPQDARTPLRLGAAAVQVKEGSSGLGAGPGPPHPSPLQLHWEDRFPQPPLVLVRLSAWGDTSQASRGAVMGLMATSAAPGDLEPQGRAPVPPGAASIGVIPLLLHLKG